MEWGRLYANLPDDPRVQAAEDNGGAGWLLIDSMCYCTGAETGGFIPHTQVERFGGGVRKKQKIAALVREKLWVPVDGGYLLNPDIWTEERNLGDSAEKKRKADRERVAAKREAERNARVAANGHGGVSRDMSRDSRATDGATCRRDSRPLYETREEKNLTADLVDHLPAADARARDDDDDQTISAVIAAAAAKTGTPVTAAQAKSAISVIRKRAAASGITIASPARYFPDAVSKEPDPWPLLLAGQLTAARQATRPPDGTHRYDHDPETRSCRECHAPQFDSRHRRRTA